MEDESKTLNPSDFTSLNIPAIARITLVLEYLNTGRELTLGILTLKVLPTLFVGFVLYTKVPTGDPDKDTWMPIDVTLSNFSLMCTELTQKQMVAMKTELTFYNLKEN